MDNNFKKIHAWQKAHELAIDIYKLTMKFPKEELYGLTSQIRRAVSSVPANIVEGYSRGTTRQYLNFLRIAKGSLAEVNYFIILANDINYINNNELSKLEKQCNEIGKMLNSTIKTLKSRVDG